MQRLPLALPLLLIPALGACQPNDTNSIFEQDPWRDDWKTVVDGAVLPGECPEGTLGCECGGGNACDAGSCQPTNDSDYCVDPGAGAGNKGGACDSGTCKPGLLCSALDAAPDTSVCIDPPGDEVRTLVIGGTDVGDNFINRGDVEVFFNGPEGQVTVQLRKFTFAPDAAQAQENWDRLIPWNYSGSVAPPSEENEPENCTQAFRDGCQVRVWYNGQTQPVRDGADIRVTLPPSYVGHLDIVTEDNIAEDQYPDRGDVTIKGLRGSAEIELDSGNVQVKLADGILEGPTCGPEAVAACEGYLDPDTMDPKPWDTNCGCTDFGQVKVASRPERATNVTVDMPGDLWGTANMENAQPGMTKSSDPLCTASVSECQGIDACEDLIYDDNFPWKRQTEFNDPGDAAPAGAGFGFPLKSESCQNVTVVDGPDDFDETAEPPTEKRGDLVVCSGCLDIPNP
jgi:hypothetical protein